MNGLIIRGATINDMELCAELFSEELAYHVNLLPELFQLAYPIFPSPWFQDVLDNDCKTLFVAELEGKVVGLILVELKNSPDDPVYRPRLIASVEELVVSEQYRHQGFGRRLMDHAREWAFEKKAEEIHLEVWEQNRAAIALYSESASVRLHSTCTPGIPTTSGLPGPP